MEPVMTPDLDNCVKFLLDTLSQVAWKDDQQVVHLVAYKCIDTVAPYEGRTIAEVTDAVLVEGFPQWSLRGNNI